MLDILINGKKIAIERGTSITFEFASNVFTTDGIEGDVAYTFDVPAKPNDLVFNSARFVPVQRRKKYDCTILLAGIPIGEGNLYVTKATKDTYSCELSVNAFAEGWRDRKLKDNDYGEDIVISNSYQEHQNKWIDFLSRCADSASNVKFPVFIDKNYYENNDDFGMWNGQINPPVGVPANIFSGTKFVNRFVYHIENGVPAINPKAYIGNPGGSHQLIDGPWNIFNEEIEMDGDGQRNEVNQFSFSPAIRLIWLLTNVVANSNYNIVGSFVNDPETNSLFYISANSMDGTIHSEYELHDSFAHAELFEDTNMIHLQNRGFLPIISDDDPYNLFDSATHSYKIVQDGHYLFKGKIQFYATPNLLYAGTSNVGGCILIIRDADVVTMSPLSADVEDNKWHVDTGYESALCALQGQYYHGYDIQIKPVGMTTAEWLYNDGGLCEVDFEIAHNFTQEDVGKRVVIEFAFFNQAIGVSHEISSVDVMASMNTNVEIEIRIDNFASYNTNIFKRNLSYSEHVPNMTNSELINTLKKMYGLCVRVNSLTKEIEFSYVADIINAKHINLTDYVLSEETEIERSTSKKYQFRLCPVDEKSYSDDVRICDVEFMDHLPSARLAQGKCALVTHLNEIYRSEKIETTTGNGWTQNWKRFSGNDTSISFGDGENSTEEISPNCKIPAVDFISCFIPKDVVECINENEIVPHPITDMDRSMSETMHFPELSHKAISYINEGEDASTVENDFPLILLKDIGVRKIPSFTDVKNPGVVTYIRRNWMQELYYQHFSPVCYDNENNRINGKDITSTGSNSIGNEYVKPWLELLSNYETITYRLILSPAKLLEVIRLLRPQSESPENQIRWIFVENVRVLPIRMTFEIVDGKETILTEIQCAKPIIN